MAFTIKAIRDKAHERVASWVGIDDFDTVKGKKNYFLGTKIYVDGKIPISQEGNDSHLRGSINRKISPYRFFRIIHTDVFEKPDIPMYIILGQRLKREGIIFNKKLGKFKCTKDKKESFLF